MKIQGQKVSEIELKNISNKSGIYCYQNIKNDKIYVGQSIHLRQRFKQHLTTKTTSYFETELQKNTDNFIFKVLCENDNYTGDVLDQLEKQFIAEYHAYEADGGYNRTHGNGIFIDLSDHQAHMGFVRNQIVATIVRWIGGDSCTGKRILLIGGFEGLAERLIQQGNKVTIITDDYTYYPTIDAEISRVDTTKDTKELENMIKDIKKDEYDIIIANPPYSVGGAIIAKFINKAKESFKYVSVHTVKDKNKAPDVAISFMITMRTILDGTHSIDGKAADIDWNVNNIADNIPWDKTWNSASCAFICFNTIKEKDNFITFWYKNPLMNELLKGLNSASGRATIAIPHIDWSIDRDYEHCTLDDIMKWLEEDNQ